MFDSGMALTMKNFWNSVFTWFQHELVVNLFDNALTPEVLHTGVSVFYICLWITVVVGVLFLFRK